MATVSRDAGRLAIRRSMLYRRILESPIAGPTITLIGVFVLFSIFVDTFLQWDAMAGIVNAATVIGVMTIGVTMLMIGGEFDLSVGPMMAWGAYSFGSIITTGKLFGLPTGNSPILALAVGLTVSSLLGALNGFLFTRFRIPSFIVTLGTQFIYRGALWVASAGIMIQTTAKSLPIYTIFNGRMTFVADAIQGANFRYSLFWLIGLVILFQFILVRTQFGSHIFATGGNPGAAAAQGVNVRRIKMSLFILTGFLSGLAGIIEFSQYTTARIATGLGYELTAIASAVVGGALLTGGSGSIVGALLGVLTISMLRTGVVRGNIMPADNFQAIVGVTIVLAAIFNNYIRRRS